MPILADDPDERPLTEADFDELISFCIIAEYEEKEFATDCYIPELWLEPEPEPDKVLEATFTKEMIAKVLGSLPLRDRELLKLRFFEDKSLEEIGTRFWAQLGLNGPVGLWGMYINEFLALGAAKAKFNQLKIASSKDLLPSG